MEKIEVRIPMAIIFLNYATRLASKQGRVDDVKRYQVMLARVEEEELKILSRRHRC